MNARILAAVGLVALVTVASAGPKQRVVRVTTIDELARAIADARPGTRIEVAAGTYAGGRHFTGPRGTAEEPVTIAAADPAKPPIFRGGGSGLQFTDPEHVELRDLAFEGQTGNGLNIDDGGTPESPAHHVVLAGLTVRDVGPDGNCDGIKLSGVLDFRVEGSTVERWGRGGSGVDMVGCARGTIERCTFRHTPEATGSGVQAKGATRDVAIRRCTFEDAGSRAVNAGGSTGFAYFRPPLAAWKGPRWEAKDLRIEGNTFAGSQAPVAFVGVDGAVFRFNTIRVPGRWAARILQETRDESFVPSRGGEFADNLVIFRSDRWSEGGVNVGSGTSPETFRFARNVWYCEDAPDRTRSLVRLPTQEEDGVHGKDAKLVAEADGELRPVKGGPASKAGAHAFRD